MEDYEMKERKGSFGSMFSGLIVGGLIGAAVALLSAPQSGVETRQMLRERSTELKDKAAEVADKTRSQAQQVISTTRERVGEVSRTARQQAAQFMRKEADMLQEGSRRMEDIADQTESGESLNI